MRRSLGAWDFPTAPPGSVLPVVANLGGGWGGVGGGGKGEVTGRERGASGERGEERDGEREVSNREGEGRKW